MSRDFQREIAWLGARSSPAFIRAPEGNGCAERFIRTLKENLLWVSRPRIAAPRAATGRLAKLVGGTSREAVPRVMEIRRAPAVAADQEDRRERRQRALA